MFLCALVSVFVCVCVCVYVCMYSDCLFVCVLLCPPRAMFVLTRGVEQRIMGG